VIAIAVVCVIAAVFFWSRDGEDLGFPVSEAQQLKDLLSATFESVSESGGLLDGPAGFATRPDLEE
jgi:hypothetical protein